MSSNEKTVFGFQKIPKIIGKKALKMAIKCYRKHYNAVRGGGLGP
jgi:hypothetical protein